jgi:hypothetical protein
MGILEWEGGWMRTCTILWIGSKADEGEHSSAPRPGSSQPLPEGPHPHAPPAASAQHQAVREVPTGGAG